VVRNPRDVEKARKQDLARAKTAGCRDKTSASALNMTRRKIARRSSHRRAFVRGFADVHAADSSAARRLRLHPNGRLARCRMSAASTSVCSRHRAMRDILIENTERFADGLPPTTRCSGAPAHGQIVAGESDPCQHQCHHKRRPPELIEIHREISKPAALMDLLRASKFRFIVSATTVVRRNDASYKSLKRCWKRHRSRPTM